MPKDHSLDFLIDQPPTDAQIEAQKEFEEGKLDEEYFAFLESCELTIFEDFFDLEEDCPF